MIINAALITKHAGKYLKIRQSPHLIIFIAPISLECEQFATGLRIETVTIRRETLACDRKVLTCIAHWSRMVCESLILCDKNSRKWIVKSSHVLRYRRQPVANPSLINRKLVSVIRTLRIYEYTAT